MRMPCESASTAALLAQYTLPLAYTVLAARGADIPAIWPLFPFLHHRDHHRGNTYSRPFTFVYDHGVPVIGIPFVYRGKVQREAGIVHQHVDRFPAVFQGVERSFYIVVAPHVKGLRLHLYAEFFFQLRAERFEPFRPAAGNNQAVTF